MTVKLGVVMDPIESIHYHKDTTLALLYEAQQRGWQISVMTPADLSLHEGRICATVKRLQVAMDPDHWYSVIDHCTVDAADFDILLMRVDPPFNTEYIYTTHLLELAEAQGVLVANKPQSLRDYNEKLATAWFPQCCPSTLVSRNYAQVRDFLRTHGDCIFKPLDGMGGRSIFRVSHKDPNVNVILETLIGDQARFMMAQRFIPEISLGDKRILMIDGEPIAYGLARIPTGDDSRGNLAAGAVGKGVELSDRDRWICAEVGPTLLAKGLWFVGLDVIGDYLTEINVTSPTCVREIDAAFDLNISAQFLDALAMKLLH